MCSNLFIILLLGNFLIPLEAVIEEYLNPTISPCDDFYQYACGKWHEVHPNVQYGDTLSLLDVTINEKLGKLLESGEEQGVLEKVKTFYKSCRNVQDYDMSIFLNIFKPQSGWTISNSWNATQFNWLNSIAELRKFGAKIFLDLSVLPRWDNSSVNVINLDIAKFQPSPKESINAILHKASLNNSLAEEFALFENQLAQMFPNADTSTENDDLAEVVLGYVAQFVPQINWVKYFSTVFGHEIDLYTAMVVQNLDNMSKLAEFLETSNPEIVCNYIMIKFLLYINQFSIENIGPNDCGTALHQAMPLAVDHIIENHFYEQEYDQVVQDLFNHLKVEFLDGVSKLYENQRNVLPFVYTKTSVMDVQIGNSDRNMSSEEVAKYYEGLDSKEDNFYFNFLEALKHKTNKDFKTLKGEPIHIAHQWTVTPSPFFLQPKNKIIVPLTLLQNKIIGKDKDTTNKYSVLGFVIGHEFLHGFDLNGVNYDYTGSIVENSVIFYCNSTFYKQVQCIKEVMGDNGIGEKIADIGGMRLAYDAYQRSLIQMGKNIMDKEGTTRSLGQSFFIDYAQFFCGKSDKSSAKLVRDVHDADEMRIKRSLMNFNTFANAFECPVGSSMNAEKKCRVW